MIVKCFKDIHVWSSSPTFQKILSDVSYLSVDDKGCSFICLAAPYVSRWGARICGYHDNWFTRRHGFNMVEHACIRARDQVCVDQGRGSLSPLVHPEITPFADRIESVIVVPPRCFSRRLQCDLSGNWNSRTPSCDRYRRCFYQWEMNRTVVDAFESDCTPRRTEQRK